MTILARFFPIVFAVTEFLTAQPLHAAVLDDLGYEDLGGSITISSSNSSIAGDLVIPENIDGKPVVSIGDNAFYGRRKITSVSLPSGLTHIGLRAFRSCERLARVNIPPGVVTIGESAFLNCEKLTDLQISFGVKTIDAYAFDGCRSLGKLDIPASVVEIRDSAFSRCDRLSDFELPPSVTTLGDSAFSRCGFTKFRIPATVTTFGTGVFSPCARLKKVTFSGERLVEIPPDMFFGCERLESVKLPGTITRIGSYAFANTGLKSIELGASVRHIDGWAFAGCPVLCLAILPSGIRQIGDHAFSDCGNLAAVHFDGKAPTLGKKVFSDAAPAFTIFVGTSAKGFTTPTWQGYRISSPAPEIVVCSKDGTALRDGESTIRFGGVLTGSGDKVVRFEIRNVGNREVTGLNARVDGQGSPDFAVKYLSRTSLATGKTAILEIAFAPKNNGKRLGRLHIMSNDKDEDPYDIEVSGKGLHLLE